MNIKERVEEEGTVYIPWSETNPVFSWVKHRNVFRILLNILVIWSTAYAPLRLKNFLYRHILKVKIGKDSALAPGVRLDYVYPDLIEIGDDVIVGQDAVILTHEYMQDHLRFGKVHIEDGACVGAKSIVRSGVTIGEKAVLGIGSMAHKDIGEGEVWVGRPMQRLKR